MVNIDLFSIYWSTGNGVLRASSYNEVVNSGMAKETGVSRENQ